MSKVSLNDIDKFSRGGGSFFKLEDGERKSVRFLYNNVDEVINSPVLVHEFTGEKFATIDCCRQDGDPMDTCKWCAMGNNPVTRVVLPIYDEESGEIQYWKKSAVFVRDTLMPVFENLPAGAPISGQIFTIGRTGKTWKDTKYTVAPDLRVMNDMKAKEQFGEIKDPYEMNMIRPNDYDFDPTPSNQSQGANNYQQSIPQATRRTADVF